MFIQLRVFLFLFLCSSSHVTQAHKPLHLNHKLNPLSAKASLIRYWNNHISNHLPIPTFLLSKASPLNAVDTVFFSQLASKHALNTRLSSFCEKANLFCEFDTNLQNNKVTSSSSDHDGNFISYNNKEFINYGASKQGGIDSFKNYSDGENLPVNAFTKYSPSSTGHSESFTNYANDGNVGNDSFISYGAGGTTGGLGEFRSYESNVNVPDLKFSSYSSNNSVTHSLTFGSYTEGANSGSQGFTTYGKNSNSVPTEFTNYATSSNIVGSTFASYGELANVANDSFKGYARNANNPHSMFKNYGSKARLGVESFESYSDDANVGDDSFQSYIRNSSSSKASFLNYEKSFNEGIASFKEYGKGGVNRLIDFKTYGANSSFNGYDDKKGINFGGYTQETPTNNSKDGIILVNSKLVEEGKFFRESMLKPGTVMKMPDIKDKMPKRSFLPLSISSKLPFSKSAINELRDVFQAKVNSTLERVMLNVLGECERAPSRGETKKCVASIEEMIVFVMAVLDDNVVVRTTQNVNGSGEKVMIGSVKGINGGKVTKSVSCHQSLLPYLLYYCHSVPKVRVYVADILDLESNARINNGVAICHLDTSDWSPGHGAFFALGSRPGLIEVCHWIYQNDMTWAIAD